MREKLSFQELVDRIIFKGENSEPNLKGDLTQICFLLE